MADEPPSPTATAGEPGEPGSPAFVAADRRVASLASGAKYKSMSPARLPIARREPCLTIPAGFSPSALLESPVLLTNLKVEPSPTTGTLSMSSFMNKMHERLSSPRETASNANADGSSISKEFEFKIPPRSSLHSEVSSSCNLPVHEFSAQNQHPVIASSTIHVASQSTGHFLRELSFTVNPVPASLVAGQHGSSDSRRSEIPNAEPQHVNDADTTMQESQIDPSDPSSTSVAEKSADDGYNWRKYGQKHVKGSENPRSYYKCTHSNCEVKKLLERSSDGQITDIVYKGEHNHPKPLPNRKLAVGAVVSSQVEENYYNIPSASEDRLPPSMPIQGAETNIVGHAELTPESTSDDEFDMESGRANMSNGNGDDEDLDSKRRKMETYGLDAALLGKPNREPRVVVQTVSEVDILDDGYRWRKYGQKVVKGNPNPRSYYKCTYIGCPVRKHVERASHDPTSVITTYEGKHNHEVPASRTASSEMSSNVKNMEVPMSNSLPQALDGILGVCDTRATATHFTQVTANSMISLDLGVGISLSHHGITANQMQPPVQEQMHYHEMQQFRSMDSSMGNPSIPVPTIPMNACINSLYDSRDGKTEVFSFKAGPIDQLSTNLCFDGSTGNVVLGP